MQIFLIVFSAQQRPFSCKTFIEYLPPPNQDSFFISVCTKEEIISNFKTEKLARPNSIPTKILRLLTDGISEHLLIIFNISFTTGIFPEKLKISQAKLIPINKKDSKLECSNYRPISLLSNIDKILEKLMHNRLTKFLTEQKILYLKQFGFRKNFSTAHAIINLIDSIENAFDQNKFACRVFIDLKKAFDTVDHEILLKKLWHYGIRGIANDWFKSYLTNRMQYVSINNIPSDLLKVNFGVPQASVPGPLLFLVYINDLHNSIRFSSPFHFADDTGLLNIQDSMHAINRTLNKDLRELSFWLNANKIALNVAKTEIILFKTSNKNYDADLKIKLCSKRINASSYVKYLGIFIDENLNWKIHINEISTKPVKDNPMLSKLRHFVNKDILLSVYYGIFHSHLAYLCLVWGQAKFSLNRITLLQKRAIRILHSAAYRDHTSPLFHRYKVLKFVDLVSLENCKFVYKCFDDEAFSLFSNHLKLTASSHSYCTRSVSNGLVFKGTLMLI